MPSFAENLRERLASQGRSLRAAARSTGMDYAFLSRVVRGLCPFPAKHAEAMAETLGLTGNDREQFIVDACLESAPPPLRAYVAKLQEFQVTAKPAKRTRGRMDEAVP